eukprot:6477950-Amphidinium_carterae.1
MAVSERGSHVYMRQLLQPTHMISPQHSHLYTVFKGFGAAHERGAFAARVSCSLFDIIVRKSCKEIPSSPLVTADLISSSLSVCPRDRIKTLSSEAVMYPSHHDSMLLCP